MTGGDVGLRCCVEDRLPHRRGSKLEKGLETFALQRASPLISCHTRAIVVQSFLALPSVFGVGGSARWLGDTACRWVLDRTWTVALVVLGESEHPRCPGNLECFETWPGLVFDPSIAFRMRH